MTKSRIALSKIDRSFLARDGNRSSIFIERRLALSQRRTPRGTPEAAGLRMSKVGDFVGASKENFREVRRCDFPPDFA